MADREEEDEIVEMTIVPIIAATMIIVEPNVTITRSAVQLIAAMAAISWTRIMTIVHQDVHVGDHTVQAEAKAQLIHQAVISHHPLITFTWIMLMDTGCLQLMTAIYL